jgi:hypothetical protein
MKRQKPAAKPQLERVRALTARSVANGARTKATLLKVAGAAVTRARCVGASKTVSPTFPAAKPFIPVNFSAPERSEMAADWSK